MTWGAADLSMFARSYVCNEWLASRLGYFFQVLPCCRVLINSIQHILPLLFGSHRMRGCIGATCSTVWPEEDFIYPICLFGSLCGAFVFFRDQENPFLLHCISSLLKDEMPNIAVSTVYDTPLYIWGFYKEVASIFRFRLAHFSVDIIFQSSRRALYWAVIDAFFPMPLYRVRFSDGPGAGILVRVRRMSVETEVKDFFFRLHTGTLPVTVWLRERGIWVPWNNYNCRLCPQEESIEHAFLLCRDAIFLGCF